MKLACSKVGTPAQDWKINKSLGIYNRISYRKPCDIGDLGKGPTLEQPNFMNFSSFSIIIFLKFIYFFQFVQKWRFQRQIRKRRKPARSKDRIDKIS